MKKTQVTMLVHETREMKVPTLPKLRSVIFQSFFWILLIIMEAYLWIFKTVEMVGWVKDLKSVWIGMILGALITIGLYIYCLWKRYVINLKEIRISNIYTIASIILTIFRICELIMILTHFNGFLSFWADGVLPFILFMWIVGNSIMGFMIRNNQLKRKHRKHRQQSQNFYQK